MKNMKRTTRVRVEKGESTLKRILRYVGRYPLSLACSLLFAAISVGRKAGCDCEKALKESVDRFATRFTKAEALALADGKVVTELSDAEWDEYYIKAKKALK